MFDDIEDGIFSMFHRDEDLEDPEVQIVKELQAMNKILKSIDKSLQSIAGK